MFSFVVFSWFLSLGVVPQQFDCVNRHYTEISSVTTSAEIGISATMFDHLTISGSMENYQGFAGGFFSPYRVDYKFALSFLVHKGITLNFAHECDHPVSSNTKGIIEYNYYANSTKIFVTFCGKEI
jgi:hypothetical protein